MEDIAVLKPSYMATVPRILNRIYGKIQDGVKTKGAFSRWMFSKAVSDKIANLNSKQVFTHSFYDSAVFKNVRALFGGNLRYMITASAPINGDVLTFFKVALGIHIFEVYG